MSKRRTIESVMYVLCVLALLLLVGMFTSCTRKVYVTNTVTDSVIVNNRVVVRDTVFHTLPASVDTVIFYEHLKTGDTFVKKNGNATLKGKKNKDNSLNLDCECDSLSIKARLVDSFSSVQSNRIETKVTTVEKRYVPAFVRWLSIIGGACLVFVIAMIVLNILERVKNKG